MKCVLEIWGGRKLPHMGAVNLSSALSLESGRKTVKNLIFQEVMCWTWCPNFLLDVPSDDKQVVFIPNKRQVEVSGYVID